MKVALSFLAVLVAAPVGAEVSVKAANGHLDVVATTAPLADVLDRVARQTGMKIVYEGAAPRQLVTVSLLGRTPAEAVNALLEGQGLNYALIADASGTTVQTLLMAGSTGPARASSSSGSAPPRATMVAPPLSSPDSADEPDEEEPAQAEIAPAAGEPAPPGTEAPSPTPGTPGVLPPGMSPAGTPAGATPPTANPGAAPAAPSPASPNQIPGLPAPPGAFPNPNAQIPGARLQPQPGGNNPRLFPVSPYSPVAPFIPAMPGGAPAMPGAPPVTTEPPDEDGQNNQQPTGPPDLD